MPDELSKVQPAKTETNLENQTGSDTPAPAITKTFPYAGHEARIKDYEYFNKLFMGDHYSAFNIRIDDENYTKAYQKLRYLKANFAGLISKVVADMLFGEPVVVKCPNGDQDWVDEFWKANKMDTQLYESALSNSANGDALFKLRIGKIDPADEDTSVIVEDVVPKIYFPETNGFNVRQKPSVQKLAWTFRIGDDIYLREEIHEPGVIRNKVYKMMGNRIMNEVGLGVLGLIEGLKEEELVDINQSLLIHVPNWKSNDRFFGISDYYDLDSLFYALNNRISKIDNILDKHSDPILMVPPGVLDEKGHVKKKALGVIEFKDGENGKPEYIVWDASLENAFKEIEKIVEFLMMVGEISPDAFGMGKGQSDSGRALKFKLMRTIAKVARKKLYYNEAIKQFMYTAQLLAKAYDVGINGVKLTKEPAEVEIDWSDGLPTDMTEQIDNETKLVDAGLTDKKSSIMRIFGVSEADAEKMMKEEQAENKIAMDAMSTTPTMGKDGKPMPDKNMPMNGGDKGGNPPAK